MYVKPSTVTNSNPSCVNQVLLALSAFKMSCCICDFSSQLSQSFAWVFHLKTIIEMITEMMAGFCLEEGSNTRRAEHQFDILNGLNSTLI